MCVVGGGRGGCYGHPASGNGGKRYDAHVKTELRNGTEAPHLFNLSIARGVLFDEALLAAHPALSSILRCMFRVVCVLGAHLDNACA